MIKSPKNAPIGWIVQEGKNVVLQIKRKCTKNRIDNGSPRSEAFIVRCKREGGCSIIVHGFLNIKEVVSFLVERSMSCLTKNSWYRNE